MTTKTEGNNTTEILQHRISWYLRDQEGKVTPTELDECSVEHISKLIGEGYNQGELCVTSDDGGTDFRGWWSIETA